MDIITKHFGPKAASQVSIVAVLFNLMVCIIFFIAGSISGIWGEAYVEGSETIINSALDHTFGYMVCFAWKYDRIYYFGGCQ